jgi:fructokinase
MLKRQFTAKFRAMQKTILSFGETLWDLLPAGPMLGGAPFNLAYRVHCLGDRGWIVSRLGADELGRKAREQIRTLGVDPSYVQHDDCHPTGTVKVTVDERGVPDFIIAPDVAYDFIEPTAELLALAAKVDCLCFGILAQRSPATRSTLYALLEAGGDRLKFLDLNLRKECHSRETITESLQRADVLKMNLQEAHHLADLFEISNTSLPDFCTELMDEWSLRCCLVTLGEHGLFACADGKHVYEPGYCVPVVDSCGSGDACAAGFIHEYLRHRPLQDCCRLSNALGAMVATQRGATTPISLVEIKEFLRQKHERVCEPSLNEFAAK